MVLFLATVAAVNATIQISVTTNKSVYQIGEAVTMSVTAYNLSDTQTLSLSFPTAEQAIYLLDSVFDVASLRQYARTPLV